MGISSFVSALFSDGRVRVAGDATLSAEELRRTDDLLTEFERPYRDDLPGHPPDLHLPAARYGAMVLYRVCQFLVFRDVALDQIQRQLQSDLPGALCPSVHYSVDLTLRFLPDASKLAAGKAPGDPLVAELVRLANQWPLSSVGLPGVQAVPVDTFIEDPCLRGLYADRIIAREDWHRVNDDRVRTAVMGALGAFPELAPGIAKAIGWTTALPSQT